MFKTSNSIANFLKRNPFEVTAFFRRSLVVTYAFPPDALAPLLSPGLALDTWHGRAFLAIAMVQTESLRPGFLPAALGRDFFLSGYRIFVRHGAHRGLQILRSDTDKPLMVRLGNLLTHYHYRLCRLQLTSQAGGLRWSVRTPGAEADLEIFEHENAGPAPLPAGSPFETLRDARRFAGPLPITYGYEPASRSLVSVRGFRTHWEPQPVAVDVRRNTFLAPGAVLANAFSVRNVPYRWTRGVRIPLEAA